VSVMTPAEAIRRTAERFPFRGYIVPDGGRYSNIAATATCHLPPGSRILDFGCGPCDATAVLSSLGFQCSAYDDFGDHWHRLPGNLDKIVEFAKASGVDLRIADQGPIPFERESFDMVMLHDVLEHLHDSPRDLLNDLVALLKPGGLLFVTVPSAVNIRKRIAVLLGRTNLPAFEGYFWHPGPWRGHVREYTHADLRELAAFLGVEIVELRGCDHMLQRLPAALRPIYRGATAIFTGLKDSWTLVARKPAGWKPRKTLPENELAASLGKSTMYSYGGQDVPREP
jgi:SAM-dependent methyltransferase